MKLKDLPARLKALAIKRCVIHVDGYTEDTYITSLFNFCNTPEGGEFWYKVNTGSFPSEYLDIITPEIY